MSNLIQIGLDVTSFSEDKKKAVNEFISLFEKLDQYSEKVYSPILGTGLLEFNKSVLETNRIIDEMNIKLSSLDESIKKSQSSSSSASKSQTELSLAMQEYKKQVDDATKSNAKLSVATSEQSKQTIALKLQLSETTKALLEEAKANNKSIQEKEALKEATRQLKEEEIQRVAALKAEVAIEQTTALESKKALAQAERELKEERRQQVSAMKAEISIEEQEIASKALEEKKAKDLANDYKVLTIALKEQATAYQQLAASKGVSSPEAKASLAQYKETASIVSTIDDNLSKASGKSQLFGGALSGAFSQLRNIAYILPGLGIAGIFNLAFEAIGKAAEEMGVLNSKLEKEIDFRTKVNESLLTTIQLNEKLYQQDKKLTDNNNGGSVASNRDVDVKSARGYDAGKILSLKKGVVESTLQQSDAEILLRGNSPETLSKDLARRLTLIQGYANKINETQKKIDNTTNPEGNFPRDKKGKRIKGAVFANGTGDKGYLEKVKKDLEDKLKLEEESYNKDNQLLEKYNSTQLDYFKIKADVDKFNSDQSRKSFIERSKSELSVTIDKNSKIADSDLSTQKEKLDALDVLKKSQIKLNYLTRVGVTGTEKNTNVSSTDKERQTSIIQEDNDNLKTRIDFQKRVEAVNKDFYQRDLKATSDSSKAEISERARLHKEEYENESLSLSQRLESYSNYLTDLKVLQEIEYQLKTKQGQVGPGGRVSLTDKQLKTANDEKVEQQSSIEAKAANDIFQIVSSSSKKILKEIVDNNKLEEENMKGKYASELADLNISFSKKELSYKEYEIKKKKIDKDYEKPTLEKAVLNDTQELSRLKNNGLKIKSNIDSGNESFNAETDVAKKKRIKAGLDAELEALNNNNLAVKNAEDKLNKDALALEQFNAKKIIEFQKQIAAEKRAIIEQLFTLTKSAVDSQYAYEIANIEKAREAKDQEYEKEIAAVEKSSLTLKDKNALEVQLREKKSEDDKKAKIEERKLKREQAEIDRALTIAHIVWTTAEAVAQAQTLPFPASDIIATERAILGAVQIATVLATKIPSFAEGTDYFEGGMARYGEAGPELVKEPYKSPYLVMKETISYLPKGTEIIPMKDNVSFDKNKVDDSWEQTRWLARQMKKSKQEIKNSFNPTINIDMSFELYKNKILGN